MLIAYLVIAVLMGLGTKLLMEYTEDGFGLAFSSQEEHGVVVLYVLAGILWPVVIVVGLLLLILCLFIE